MKEEEVEEEEGAVNTKSESTVLLWMAAKETRWSGQSTSWVLWYLERERGEKG